ncbi:RNA polymerase subunit sigma-70, partial [Enterococcus faecium]
MRTSSFEHIVRLQFNSLMLIVIKNKVKSRNRQLARHSKREVLFCEIAETKQVERG